MSTTITCNLVISNFLSLLFFCFLLVNVVNNESHFGHLSSTHVNVLGHFPGNWSVSAASYPDTNLRTLVSGILEFFSRYSAVLLRYFCDKPQSSLCCSQSSSWKCQCHKIKKIHWNFLIQNNPKNAGHLQRNIRAVQTKRYYLALLGTVKNLILAIPTLPPSILGEALLANTANCNLNLRCGHSFGWIWSWGS